MNEYWKRRLRKINPSTWAYRERSGLPSALLVGSARSGTTWIEEVIHSTSSYRMMFEPFHPGKVTEFRNFLPYQYLRPDDGRPEFIEPVSAGLQGKARSFWIDQFNKRIFFKKRLIKDVRCLLYLNWLHNAFPNTPIIFLIRHPIPVALSRSKLNFPTELDNFLIQDELMNDHLEPYRELITEDWSPFEAHIVSWCIENLVPLSSLPVESYCPVFYEHISLQPTEQFHRIFSYLDEDDIPSGYDISKPSSLSQRNDNFNKNDHIRRWRNTISENNMERALNIIKAFGMDKLYDQNPEPKIQPEMMISLNSVQTLLEQL